LKRLPAFRPEHEGTIVPFLRFLEQVGRSCHGPVSSRPRSFSRVEGTGRSVHRSPPGTSRSASELAVTGSIPGVRCARFHSLVPFTPSCKARAWRARSNTSRTSSPVRRKSDHLCVSLLWIRRACLSCQAVSPSRDCRISGRRLDHGPAVQLDPLQFRSPTHARFFSSPSQAQGVPLRWPERRTFRLP
jgi:hypothetical protein